jgi:hypothetical protein
MQKYWILSLALLSAQLACAQSLMVVAMDSIAYVNSHNGIQATAHISVKNSSASVKDYRVLRRRIGTTGLVDSNYFCWDLCYPTWANQSQGTVTIAPGATANDFSGYAYVRDTSANGQDSIWYTFVNAADANDSLQVSVVYAFNRYVSNSESALPLLSVYPQPAFAGQRVYGIPTNALKLEWMDLAGRVHEAISQNDGSVLAPSAQGIWILRAYFQNGVRTTRVLLQ